MIKGYALLALMSVFLLCGCSEETIKKNSNIPQNTDTQNESNIVEVSDNKENYGIPFKINKIDSLILDLNDLASEKPLKGVRYEILLFSKEKIPAESFMSYEFQIDANEPLKEFLGPIQTLTMSKTSSDGYIYTLAFETIYGEHSQVELEALKKERDFNIFVIYEEVRYPVEYQS